MFTQIFPPNIGVANSTRKIQGLGKFCFNLEISEAFLMRLEISFSCVSLRLGVSDFVFFGQRSKP